MHKLRWYRGHMFILCLDGHFLIGGIMVEVAKVMLEFIAVFLIVYFGYYFFSYRKLKKYDRKKSPVNIKYLVLRYNLDIVRLGYKRVFKTLMLSDAFIVAFMFTITRIVDNVYVRLLVSFILIFPLFAGVYHLVAMYYKKESE